MLHVGARVRVAARPALEALLHGAHRARPLPAQYVCAGRASRVLGVVRDREGAFLYRLAGLPGPWREEWLLPCC